MKKQTNFFWSTGNWVVLYSLFYMALLILYSLPRMAISIAGPQNAHVVARYLPPGCFDAIGDTISIFGWGLLALITAYAGIDRASLALKSSQMKVGSCDMGSPEKLRKMIYILFAVFAVAVICNYFHSDFVYHNPVFRVNEEGVRVMVDEGVDAVYPGVKIPLTETASALVSAIVLYVTGNKSIRLTQNLDTTKPDQDWANEQEEEVLVKDSEEEPESETES